MKTMDIPPSNLGRLRCLTEELTTEETELFLFFKLSPDMFCLADNRYFRKLNDAWARILGWTNEELLESPYLNFVHPDDIERTKKILSHMDKSDIIRFHHRFRKKDDEYVVLEWSATLWTDGLTYASARPVPLECMTCPESIKRFGEILGNNQTD